MRFHAFLWLFMGLVVTSFASSHKWITAPLIPREGMRFAEVDLTNPVKLESLYSKVGKSLKSGGFGEILELQSAPPHVIKIPTKQIKAVQDELSGFLLTCEDKKFCEHDGILTMVGVVYRDPAFRFRYTDDVEDMESYVSTSDEKNKKEDVKRKGLPELEEGEKVPRGLLFVSPENCNPDCVKHIVGVVFPRCEYSLEDYMEKKLDPLQKDYDSTKPVAVTQDIFSSNPQPKEKKKKAQNPAGIRHNVLQTVSLGVLPGLVHFNKMKLQHRDVKPDNIMRCGGRWKLIDFGTVTKQRDCGGYRGTPGWSPPCIGPLAAGNCLKNCLHPNWANDIASFALTLGRVANGYKQTNVDATQTEWCDKTLVEIKEKVDKIFDRQVKQKEKWELAFKVMLRCKGFAKDGEYGDEKCKAEDGWKHCRANPQDVLNLLRSKFPHVEKENQDQNKEEHEGTFIEQWKKRFGE